MQNRRSFLTSAALVAAGLPLAGWAKAMPAAMAEPLSVQRFGKFFLVNGWVLTAEDVAALEAHAA